MKTCTVWITGASVLVFGMVSIAEIKGIDRNAPEAAEAAPQQKIEKAFEAEGGKYQFAIDTSAAPDLTEEWQGSETDPEVRLEKLRKVARASKVLMLKGAPGTGKTTIAKALAIAFKKPVSY